MSAFELSSDLGQEVLKPASRIAIDGPGGVGKTTIGNLLSERLGYNNLTSGLYFCAAGIMLRQLGENISEDEKNSAMREVDIDFDMSNPGEVVQVAVNGVDVTDTVSSSDSKMGATLASRNAVVIERFTPVLRDIGQQENIIMEGKVVGRELMPDADLKIFLTADPATRAYRRWQQILAEGEAKTFQQIYKEVMERDARDRLNPHLAMKPAPDAVILDTTYDTVKQTYARIEQLIMA